MLLSSADLHILHGNHDAAALLLRLRAGAVLGRHLRRHLVNKLESCDQHISLSHGPIWPIWTWLLTDVPTVLYLATLEISVETEGLPPERRRVLLRALQVQAVNRLSRPSTPHIAMGRWLS